MPAPRGRDHRLRALHARRTGPGVVGAACPARGLPSRPGSRIGPGSTGLPSSRQLATTGQVVGPPAAMMRGGASTFSLLNVLANVLRKGAEPLTLPPAVTQIRPTATRDRPEEPAHARKRRSLR